MKQTLHLTAPRPLAGSRSERGRRASLLDVCAALYLTLSGLLGREGIPNGE